MILPQTVSITVPPEIGPRRGPFVYHVVDLGDGRVRLSHDADGRFGPVMPRASVKHFVNDQSGKVVLPLRGHKEIDAILKGRAQLLGKGDDGLTFRVGSKVVKVSTTVPFQPDNPGHLSPDEAVERLRAQTVMHNKLATIAPNNIDKAEFVKHGDKGFQIKPYVEIPERFTRPQLDQVQDAIIAIHRAGYSTRDEEIQVGLRKGKPILFDLGKAGLLPANDAKQGIYSHVKIDMDNLCHLYKKSGQTCVRRDIDEAQKKWDQACRTVARSKPNDGYAIREVQRAAQSRRDQAEATLRGRVLEKQLRVIEAEERRELAKLRG